MRFALGRSPVSLHGKKPGPSAFSIQFSSISRNGGAGLLNLKNLGALAWVLQPGDAVIDFIPPRTIDMQATRDARPAEQMFDILNVLASNT